MKKLDRNKYFNLKNMDLLRSVFRHPKVKIQAISKLKRSCLEKALHHLVNKKMNNLSEIVIVQ